MNQEVKIYENKPVEPEFPKVRLIQTDNKVITISLVNEQGRALTGGVIGWLKRDKQGKLYLQRAIDAKEKWFSLADDFDEVLENGKILIDN